MSVVSGLDIHCRNHLKHSTDTHCSVVAAWNAGEKDAGSIGCQYQGPAQLPHYGKKYSAQKGRPGFVTTILYS